MRMRASLAVIVALAGLPAGADPTPADCAMLSGMLQISGYSLTAPPSGAEAGWCVMDGAAWRSDRPGWPDLTAERMRVRGSVDATALVSLEVDVAGGRVLPQAGDRALDDRLRGLVRLQTVEMRFAAVVDAETDRLDISGGVLRLSGGSEVTFGATVAGGGLTAMDLASGSLTALDLEWRNDGRLLRPVMEMAGERLAGAPTGSAAVDAARLALRQVVDALPETALADDTRPELEQLVTALPQGRGRLTLSLSAPEGIGASRLLLAGLTDNPLGPKALAGLLQGARVTAVWSPGILP
jgi:hypothetical protein